MTQASESGPDIRRESEGVLARPVDLLPDTLPILPLVNRPFFPAQVVPLVLDKSIWQASIRQIADSPQRMLGLVLARAEDPAEVKVNDFAAWGTACRLHRVVEQEDKLQIMVEGLQRFRIKSWLHREIPFAVRAEYYPEARYEAATEIKAYSVAIINTIKELLPLNPLYGEELKFFLTRMSPEEPSNLGDFAASLTSASRDELQEVLEATDILPRLEKVLTILKKEVEVAHAQASITKRVEARVNKQQREFFLREQMKAIQKELGLAKDDRTAESDRFTARLKALTLTDEAQKRVEEEMQKFSVLEQGSPEYAVTRNYLDWLTLLPWGKTSEDRLDLARARRILDRDHAGLDDVKDRIIEQLAVGVKKGAVSGSILLLVGPPGVGKTSIGKSVAEALGRKFYRLSLGGMRDEAEIKGHRRTYIGAQPGKFVQALKTCGTANPVIMLDEVDKIGASYQGDPASALLEVLDPAQNGEFLDHYLDVRFDLSRVLFVCTANQLDSIPGPLLDRMEVIRLSGYLTSEKLTIGRRHLLPRILKENGLAPRDLGIAPAALKQIIEGYAREAGVRSLEKRLAQIARKVVVRVLKGKKPPVQVAEKDIEGYLGKPLFEPQTPRREVGVVTGLAWTSLGGVTLDVEAAVVHMHGRGLKLTGSLGDVMRESAEIALSHLSSQAADYGISKDWLKDAFIHLHVPEGATPKDGPSAGITLASALLSLARGTQPARAVAMTGEITLMGEVLPVGGIREKVTAARRAHLKQLILPKANRRDWNELPKHVRAGLKVHFCGHFRQVAGLLWPAGRIRAR